MDSLYANTVDLVNNIMGSTDSDTISVASDLSDRESVIEVQSVHEEPKKKSTFRKIVNAVRGERGDEETTEREDENLEPSSSHTIDKELLEMRARLLKLEAQALEREREKERQGPECPVLLPDFTRPVKFSFKNAQDIKIIESHYPKKIYSDGSRGCDIYDFLFLLSDAHKDCPISERDFKTVLVQRLGGSALDLVSGFIRDKESVAYIYSELYATFSDNLSAHEARGKMRIYKSPRSFGIRQLLGELGMLGNIAGRSGNGPKANRFLVSLLTQDGLESALPEEAYKLVHREIAKERYRLGREPIFREIRACLAPEAENIDLLIKRAKDHKFPPQRKLFSICKQKSQFTESEKGQKGKSVANVSINEMGTSKNAQPSQSKGKTNKQNQAKGGNKDKQTDKQASETTRQKQTDDKERRFCVFCGRYGHDTYQGCFAIMDDNCKVYQGAGARENCRHCLIEVNLGLKHPESKCPTREFMQEQYRTGRVTPREPWKKWWEEKKKKGNK